MACVTKRTSKKCPTRLRQRIYLDELSGPSETSYPAASWECKMFFPFTAGLRAASGNSSIKRSGTNGCWFGKVQVHMNMGKHNAKLTPEACLDMEGVQKVRKR